MRTIIRFISSHSKKLILIGCSLTVCSCNRTAIDMSELPPEYSVSPPENLPLVPVIVVGQVLERCKPIGVIHPSRWNGSPQQLWKVSIAVEHILQGDVQADEADIYYFVYRGSLGNSEPGLMDLDVGDYEIFFLQRDNGRLRTICDGGHNCVVRVWTGAHPNYKRSSSGTINEAITDILLTRGPGTTDQQMSLAMRRFGNFGQQAAVKAFQRIATTEKPQIAADACLTLEHAYNPPHPCSRAR